jgi:hypothetical protein
MYLERDNARSFSRLKRLPFGRRPPFAYLPDVMLEALAETTNGALRCAALEELDIREGSDRSGRRVSVAEALGL